MLLVRVGGHTFPHLKTVMKQTSFYCHHVPTVPNTGDNTPACWCSWHIPVPGLPGATKEGNPEGAHAGNKPEFLHLGSERLLRTELEKHGPG